MKKYIFLLFLMLPFSLFSQEDQEPVLRLTLKEAIDLAQIQSPSILMYRHSFRSSYWSYVSYKANYLPSLTVSSSPNFNHSINPVTLSDGTLKYVEQNQLSTNLGFSLSQNIALTGGTFSLQTSLARMDILNNDTHSYNSTPLAINYRQSLFGYNSFKWERKLEPLRFEGAKRSYVENLELVASAAVNRFFALAMAQTNLDMAKLSYANADTLYNSAQGRYDIGRITETDMLQLEINKLSAEGSLLSASLSLDDAMEELRTFLGITSSERIEVVVESDISLESVDYMLAYQEALLNNADVIAFERRKIEAESNLASAKASVGLKADLYMQLGLGKSSSDFGEVYKNPSSQQRVEVGFSLPILDWGRGKGRLRVAQSSRDNALTQIEQDRISFEMNIKKVVKQFNLQTNQLRIAEKTDIKAQKRSEVAQKLYLLGKSTILDLNSSISERDAAKRTYMSTLQQYWTLYYALRSLTLYDFEKDIPITEDYDLLIK